MPSAPCLRWRSPVAGCKAEGLAVMPTAPCLRWRSPVAGCKAEGLAVMPTAPCLSVYVRVYSS